MQSRPGTLPSHTWRFVLEATVCCEVNFLNSPAGLRWTMCGLRRALDGSMGMCTVFNLALCEFFSSMRCACSGEEESSSSDSYSDEAIKSV